MNEAESACELKLCTAPGATVRYSQTFPSPDSWNIYALRSTKYMGI